MNFLRNSWFKFFIFKRFLIVYINHVFYQICINDYMKKLRSHGVIDNGEIIAEEKYIELFDKSKGYRAFINEIRS